MYIYFNATRTQALELQARMEDDREHKERLERLEKARRRESLAYRVHTYHTCATRQRYMPV